MSTAPKTHFSRTTCIPLYGNQINALKSVLIVNLWIAFVRVNSFCSSYVCFVSSQVDCRDSAQILLLFFSSFHCVIFRLPYLSLYTVSTLFFPFTSSSSSSLTHITFGRLLGSKLVRIRPNRAVSSVGRERTSATRDAASSP